MLWPSIAFTLGRIAFQWNNHFKYPLVGIDMDINCFIDLNLNLLMLDLPPKHDDFPHHVTC